MKNSVKNSVLISAMLLSGFAVTSISFAQNNNNKANMETKPKSVNHLTDIQKYITQHGGTEPAFQNEYWDNKQEGIYVDVVSGEALFSSTDKFDSGTGWPSFTKPINQTVIENKPDNKYGMERTEVRSKNSDSHLGHVFNDGPKEHGGSRFCINSGALKFIPKDKLKEQGYAQYLSLFEKK
jgi:methionine-R-sulfoxide reductase